MMWGFPIFWWLRDAYGKGRVYVHRSKEETVFQSYEKPKGITSFLHHCIQGFEIQLGR
jgi:hypothetical protein